MNSLAIIVLMVKSKKHRRNETAISIVAMNIKKYRKLKGLTITQLANMLEVDYTQVGRMERSVVNPNISIIWDIAEILKIKPSQLLEE